MNFCECEGDGFCPRYNHQMGGRMRELCAGINVDLGTAAAFREQWAREARATSSTSPPAPVLLKTGQAPGDAVAMTAAIYSLHKTHPGKYATSVESYWPEVFMHNPDVSSHLMAGGDATTLPGVAEVQMHYPAIHQSNDRAIHFMQGWCSFLGDALGINIPLLTNRPRLYFNTPTPPCEDFWLVCSGGKRDFTNKLWGHYNYQKVVNILKGTIKFVQVGGGRPPVPWDASTKGSQEDNHPRLVGTNDMVGKTTLRELFELTQRARGVLCGVSLLMHVAAALEKPAVVIAGGREPVSWNSYPNMRFLHTVGSLNCHDVNGRSGGACWRYRVVPLGDGTVLDNNTCEHPVNGTPTKLTKEIVPRCMTIISPEYVAETITQTMYSKTHAYI